MMLFNFGTITGLKLWNLFPIMVQIQEETDLLLEVQTFSLSSKKVLTTVMILFASLKVSAKSELTLSTQLRCIAKHHQTSFLIKLTLKLL